MKRMIAMAVAAGVALTATAMPTKSELQKAPKLHAIKEAARRQAFYRKQLAKAEVAVQANPKDAAAQKKLGECHAELGDWPKALDAFALAGGKLAKTAEAEKAGTAAPHGDGDFDIGICVKLRGK